MQAVCIWNQGDVIFTLFKDMVQQGNAMGQWLKDFTQSRNQNWPVTLKGDKRTDLIQEKILFYRACAKVIPKILMQIGMNSCRDFIKA